MESSSPTRVLVVAYRTAATPTLVEEVRARADAARDSGTPVSFTLLVPDLHAVSEESADREAELIIALALPLLEEAAGAPVDGIVGNWDPEVAARELVAQREFDEILVSTLPARVSRWLSRDLPGRLSDLGVPVSVLTSPGSARAVSEASPPSAAP
jgi:alkanesulfonate monooxygenase SsuD/methylene tetrahydromethanopterin reductase-like flavin-dependent oxidoreductase (luciferase family)